MVKAHGIAIVMGTALFFSPNAGAQNYGISTFPANSILGPYGPVLIPSSVRQFIQNFNDGGSVGAVNASGQMAINVSSIIAGSGDPNPQQSVFVYLPAPAYGLPAGINSLFYYGVPAYGSAYSINNSGQVAGTVGDGVGVWNIGNSNGNLDDGAGVQAGLAGLAPQINDSGQIIMQNFESEFGRVYLCSPTPENGYAANATDLTPDGTEYPTRSYIPLAVGINNHGDALYDAAPVTYYGDPSTVFQAYLHVGSSHNSLAGGSTYTLSGIGWSIYEAAGLNESGQVVGMATFTNGGTSYDDPVLWSIRSGGIDLNSLLPADSGWVLQTVTGIDELGDIEGAGLYNGVSTPFLLSVPEPGGRLIAVLGVPFLSRRRFRRHYHT